VGLLFCGNTFSRLKVDCPMFFRLEHTRILGDTIEKIATDKAGIIKPGVPVLVGDSCPHSVIKVGGEALALGRLLSLEYDLKTVVCSPLQKV
jgi:hypothetical protein